MARYEIILKNETKTASKTGKKATTKNDASDSSEGGIRRNGQVLMAYNYAKRAADQYIQHQVSTVALRTGQAERQQMIELNYQIGQRILSVVESVAMGAMLGGGAGAIVGAAASIGFTGMGILYKRDTINLQRQVENVSISMGNIRAGTFSGRGGKDL